MRPTADKLEPASRTSSCPSGGCRHSWSWARAWFTSSRARTIVLPEDRTDQTAYVGAGLRFYLTRRFFVRADYRWHTIFTSRDDNEELEEWKVLIACFF